MKFYVKLVAVVLLGMSTACDELIEISPVSGDDSDVKEDSLTEVPTDEKKIVQYIIEKGHHYPNKNYFQTISLNELDFSIMFDSTAIYQTTEPTNQGDINKLYGFSDCNDFHHTNSARFGWRWYNDQLEIFGYVYANGKRAWKYVDSVPLNSYNSYSILVEEDNYVFTLNDKSVSIPRHCATEVANGYMLYPYFGGDESAPEEINIFFEEM